MKKYFSPVEELDAPEVVTTPSTPVEAEFPADFKAWITQVNEEITRIGNGTSSLRWGINLTGNVPALAAWNLFQTSPAKLTLARFFDLARQDFGRLVRNTFWQWLLESHPQMAAFEKEFRIQ